MICRACREERHSNCPETARQETGGLKDYELVASAWCDCQHQAAGSGTPS